VSTFGGYEAICFGIQALFDLHPDYIVMHVDVENIFNNTFELLFIENCVMPRGL
jgi:hypothetical protein